MLWVTIKNSFVTPSPLIHLPSHLFFFPICIFNPFKYFSPVFSIRRTALQLGVIFTGLSILPLFGRLHNNLGLMPDLLLFEKLSCILPTNWPLTILCWAGFTAGVGAQEEKDEAAFSSLGAIFSQVFPQSSQPVPCSASGAIFPKASPQGSQALSLTFPLSMCCFASSIVLGRERTQRMIHRWWVPCKP